MIRSILEKQLFERVIYKEHFVHYDKYGTHTDSHRFDYDIIISKCYFITGCKWKIEVPNGEFVNRNLFEAVVEAIEFATTKFPQYFRLEDELLRKDLLKLL